MAVQTNVSPVGGARRLAIGRNTLILLAVNFSSAGFGLLISVLIGRGLGAAVLGAYSLALAWNLTLAQFAELGMNTLLTRDLAREPAETSAYVRGSLIAKTVLGIILALALVLAAPLLAQAETTRVIQLGAGLILLNAWYGTFTGVFRSFGRMMPILILNAGGLGVQAILTLLLVMRGATAEAFVLLAAAIQLGQLIGAWILYAREFASASTHISINLAYVINLVRAGIPFAIAGILSTVELRANLFMLGALGGDQAAGLYSAASRLNDGLRLVPNAFFGAILPALAALGTNSAKARLDSIFRRSEWALLAFGGVAAILLTWLAPWLIPALYTETFAPSIPVLIVLVWDLIPALVSGLLVLYLYARGDEHYVNWLIGIGLVVQVLAAFPLIRNFGAVGAATATLASDIVLWFLLRGRIAQIEKGAKANWRIGVERALPPIILFLVALALRVIPIFRNSFDGLYGQDAYAYYSYARDLFSALAHLQPPPPFWWPLGYPLLLNLGFLFGGVSVASAQAVTVLCGVLVAPLAYAIAREVSPEESKSYAAWVAGLLCAVVGQLVQSSVVIMADAPALMWASFAAWLLLRYRRTQSLGTLVIASLAAALAVWTRWENSIFAVVWLGTLLMILALKRMQIYHLIFAVALFALVLSPQLFIHINSNAPLAGQSWLEGWSPTNFFARAFDTVDGHADYALPVSIFYAQVLLHPAYLVAVMTPFLLLGAWQLLKRFRADPAPVVLLLGWSALMLFFLMGIPFENFRFPLGLFVPIAVMTGIGVGWVWTSFQIRGVHIALTGWIAASLLLMIVWEPRVLAPVLETKTRELSDARWLEQQFPPDALLYTMDIDGAIAQYTPLHVINLNEMDPATLRDDIPTYLYINLSEIHGQWRGRLPEQLVNALDELQLLHKLSTRGDWTLFHIRECKYRILDCD